MKSKDDNLILCIFYFMLFVIIVSLLANVRLLMINSTLKATPVATCPTPIVTAEQLEQAGYNLDKLFQVSIKQK